MPNIKQQKKRVRIANEERLENLRYASTVKTLTRRLRAAVDEGDRGRVEAEHRELVAYLDLAGCEGDRRSRAESLASDARLLVESIGWYLLRRV